MPMVRNVLLILLLANSFLVRAQFELNAQIRPRTELRNGYRFPAGESSELAFFVSQRTRLSFLYNDTMLDANITLQDVRVWGDETIASDNPGLGIAMAYATLRPFKDFSVRAGRQEISLGDQRLFGMAEWRQAARSHDALWVRWQPGKYDVSAIGAFNQNAERLGSTSYGLNQYKALGILYAKREGALLDVDGIMAADGIQNLYSGGSETDWRYTTGLNVAVDIASFKLFAGQHIQRGTRFIDRKDIRAFMGVAGASYSFGKWRFNFTTEVLSGRDSTSEDYTAFDNLYASRHRFFGYMDYFVSFPFDPDEGGLQHTQLSAAYRPAPQHTIELTGHSFYLEERVRDAATGVLTGKELGQELDLLYTFDMRSDISVTFGHSLYWSTDDLALIKGGDPSIVNHFTYLMLDVRPVFFRSKGK
jgi:hypothetical protein